jgi:hypothetical protein
MPLTSIVPLPNVSAPVPAAKVIDPPVPLEGAMFIVLMLASVRFSPEEILTVPPLPDVVPPVAVRAIDEFIVMSDVADVLVNEILPPLPLVEPALALNTLIPPAVKLVPLNVMLPPLKAPLPLDCAEMVVPLSVKPPAAEVILIEPALALEEFTETLPVRPKPPLPAVMVTLVAAVTLGVGDMEGMTIWAPAPLAVIFTAPLNACIVPRARTSFAACGLIVTVVAVAFTIPNKLPGPVTVTDDPDGAKFIVPRLPNAVAFAERLPCRFMFTGPVDAKLLKVIVPPAAPAPVASALTLPFI